MSQRLGRDRYGVRGDTLYPLGIESAEAFGVPQVKGETQTLSPDGIDSAETLGDLTVYLNLSTLGPDGIPSSEAFGTPTVRPVLWLVHPTAIASGEALGSLTVIARARRVLPLGIPSAEAFGVPLVEGYYAGLDFELVPAGAIRVTVMDASGTVLGHGPLLTASQVAITRSLDMSGKCDFEVPLADPAAAPIALGGLVQLNHRVDGLLGQFIVRQTTLNLTRGTLRVSCLGLTQELVYFSCGLNRKYDNIPLSEALSTNFISGSLYGLFNGTGWNHAVFDFDDINIVVLFSGQTILQALDMLRNRFGMHFRLGTALRTIDFGDFGDDSGYRLIHPDFMSVELEGNPGVGLIEDLSVDTQEATLINKLIPMGGGVGTSQLTLEKATAYTAPYDVRQGTNSDGSKYWYIRDDASATLHRERSQYGLYPYIVPLSNNDQDVINAANALYTEGVTYLKLNRDGLKNYSIKVIQCPVGLREGDLVRLVYRGVARLRGSDYVYVDENALYWVMDRTDNYDDGGKVHSTSLVLSSNGLRAQSGTSVLVGALQQIQIGQTHVQPYPSEFNDTFEEELDPSHPVEAQVDIDKRILFLNSCTLRLRTKPLRATFTSAQSGGGTTQSSDSKGGQTPTSGPSSASTSDYQGGQIPTSSGGSAHKHNVQINGTPSVGGWPAVYVASQALWYVNAGSVDIQTYTNDESVHQHTVTISTHRHDLAHTHTVAVAAHQHSVTIPAHGHPLTFGVIDDTLYPQNIRISIDGTDRTAALGGPWSPSNYTLDLVIDITSYLINALGGVRQLHRVTISCGAGQGKIRVLTKCLTTVQAIAVTV